uniref:Uncharacterized protein n=1 Tax=Glossina palpalis gambiensis TaxID=67801 RepID=A0A1B0ASB4_9MUSC
MIINSFASKKDNAGKAIDFVMANFVVIARKNYYLLKSHNWTVPFSDTAENTLLQCGLNFTSLTDSELLVAALSTESFGSFFIGFEENLAESSANKSSDTSLSSWHLTQKDFSLILCGSTGIIGLNIGGGRGPPMPGGMGGGGGPPMPGIGGGRGGLPIPGMGGGGGGLGPPMASIGGGGGGGGGGPLPGTVGGIGILTFGNLLASLLLVSTIFLKSSNFSYKPIRMISQRRCKRKFKSLGVFVNASSRRESYFSCTKRALTMGLKRSLDLYDAEAAVVIALRTFSYPLRSGTKQKEANNFTASHIALGLRGSSD